MFKNKTENACPSSLDQESERLARFFGLLMDIDLRLERQKRGINESVKGGNYPDLPKTGAHRICIDRVESRDNTSFNCDS